MKLFVQQSHLPYSLFIVISSIVLCFAAIIAPLNVGNIELGILRIFAIAILTLLAIRYVKTFGLYIDGTEIVYKSFVKKRLDPQKIAAIRITKAVWLQKYGPASHIRDQHGTPMYTMIFTKEYNEELRRELQDMDFRDWFKKQIICFSTYDQSVIDYLKTLILIIE